MRYYEVLLPGRETPIIATNVRDLRNLPKGTRITAYVTERGGTVADVWDIPVENGRAKIRGRGKNQAKSVHRRY